MGLTLARRRLSLHAYSILHSKCHALPSDVDPTTGLCADGRITIANSAPGMGLGAFANGALKAATSVGQYQGETLLFDTMHVRYGDEPPGDAIWHGSWLEQQHFFRQERAQRGVGATGHYVFKFGTHPTSGRLLLIDAEDPEHANWTRFLNHSSEYANLDVQKAVEQDLPVIRFITNRAIEQGEELLIDYGPNYFEGRERSVVECGSPHRETSG